MEDALKKNPHRRYNALTGEWILVSPQRWERPWQGRIEPVSKTLREKYDAECYLCPGNKRADGKKNQQYTGTFVFTNDFSALIDNIPSASENEKDIFNASSERGICRVLCFSPDHSLTLADMEISDIEKVVSAWKKEYSDLEKKDFINNILIFENKGGLMGNSNPHPHCQIWAQESIPVEVEKETKRQEEYFHEKGECMLCTYLKSELIKDERVIFSNDHFSVIVPFWAVWPYETIIIGKRHLKNITEMTDDESWGFAEVIQKITKIYDKVFNAPFPYSAGIHQAPVNGNEYPGWHFHMHFYPPLLRSASVKKFMVGYEMLGNPQRDITPEYAAEVLKNLVKSIS